MMTCGRWFFARAGLRLSTVRGLMLVVLLAGLVRPDTVRAGEPAPQPTTPATIIESSPNVSIGGIGATRQGDATSAGAPVITGSPDVFINGKPAARSGDVTGCNGVVVGSGANVFINGKPAARLGDQANCPGR